MKKRMKCLKKTRAALLAAPVTTMNIELEGKPSI